MSREIASHDNGVAQAIALRGVQELSVAGAPPKLVLLGWDLRAPNKRASKGLPRPAFLWPHLQPSAIP